MKYMLIDTTTVEETKVLAVATLTRIQLLGRLAQADDKKVIAPPLQNRGFSKLEKLPLQYLFWNTCQRNPPEIYEFLCQECLAAIEGMVEDLTPLDELEAEVLRRCPPVVTSQDPSGEKVEGAAASKPRTAGATGRVWEIADQIFAKVGMDRKAIIEACEAAGINAATAATQFAKWKKTKSI